ncbi:hypothetical protein LFREDSHE_18790 [Shewanella baltica]
MHTKILGTGSYLPVQVRSNQDLEKMVETTDQWIVERTGISERRIAAFDETVSTMGYQAALKALEMAGIEASDLDMIVCGTTSAPNAFPAAACEIKPCLACIPFQHSTSQRLVQALFMLYLLLTNLLKRALLKKS